ncbi:MAG: SHOCT domain-containing protein [Solirubrobacteraceae bacterium]
MFGHDWQPAQAKIVDKRLKSASGGGVGGTYEFVADVQPADGPVFRATIQEPDIATDFWAPERGDVIKVLIDPKSHKVKFDKSDPKISYKAHRRAAQERFDAEARATPPSVGVDAPTGVAAAAAADESIDISELLRSAVQARQGARDPAERLAKLQALKDQGVLSDAEYTAARQQIIESI